MAKTPTTSKSSTKSGPTKRKRVTKASKSEDESGVKDIEDIGKFNEKEIAEIRSCLLSWYDNNKRDLPWRNLNNNNNNNDDKKAYGVWVSEVMLQQTRVATVVDYFNRWMQKWPSLHHLSLASLEEVNEMWAGLGYYRRARYLLEGAKKIVEGGNFPRTVSSLRKIPGIGDYTAGAIASIAFNEVVPVVDGNVVRVLARLKAISANPKDSVTVREFWRLAGQLVDPYRPGEFNQALMELGATLCTPTSPSCSDCPVSVQCKALSLSQQGNLVTDYPMKVVKAKQRNEFSAVCVLEISETLDSLDGTGGTSRYLLVKRPDEGLLAGLWEFPSILVDEESKIATRRKAIDNFLKTSFHLEVKKTCKVIIREEVGEYVHIFSHIRLKMYVEYLKLHWKGGLNSLLSLPDEGRMVWKCVDSTELSSMGLTSGVRKVYTMVQRFKEKSLPAATQDSKTTKFRKRR